MTTALRARTAQLQSTLFNFTWKTRTTQSGNQIIALRATTRKNPSNFTSWPTPNSGPQNDGDTTWQERRIALKAKHGNGNGFGMNLGQASTLAAWPTPMAGTPAQKGYNEAGNTDSSRKTVALVGWPSPKASNTTGAGTRGEGGENLQTVASWATPSARDFKSNEASEEHHAKRFQQPRGKPLSEQAHQLTTPRLQPGFPAAKPWHSLGLSENDSQLTASGETPTGSPASTVKRGQLNPAHSRWLMGLPPEWDACAPQGMRSARRKRRNSSGPTA